MQTLKVFLSSPGDVSEERALAERVMKRLGEEYRERVRLVVVLWEHEPLFAHAGFQEQIERPSQCDLVISILWSRLGTRLPASFKPGPHESPPTGTEFEVQDALEGYRRLGRPHLLIYRRTAPPHVNLASPDAEERLQQYRLLQDFCRRAFYDEQGAVIVAHHDYAESWEFERKLGEHARKWLERTVGQSAVLPRWTAGSPYRGLEAFEAEHREIYFGRSHAQSELIELLRAVEERATGSAARFLLVLGMSGNGKSSLVRAGLLPLLEGRAVEGIGSWRQLIMKPSDQGAGATGVFGALAERLLVALPRLQSAYTPATLTERLRSAPAESVARLDGYLTEEASRLGLKADQIRLVLFVDQLEEIWSPTVCAEERQGLMRTLATLAREGRSWVIATLRGDFAANLESVPELNALLKEGRLYVLAAPQGDELGEMIREPAAAAGLEWESKEGLSLDQAIQREASSSPESLPLLEYALDQLYERRDGRRLTYAAYEALGKLSGGIAASAEAVLTEQGATAAPALQKLLRSLVSVDESGQATRRYARVMEIPEGSPERALLDRLIERRLCVTDNRGQGAEVSLAHEALLRSWPRLTDWLAQESGLLQMRELAQRDTRLWLEHGRSAAWLAGADKVVAFAAIEAAAIPLGAEVREFIDRSRHHVRRTTRIKQAAVALIALLAVAASIGGWMASRKEREAEYQTAQARKSQLQVLTQVAADRLKEGDLALARGIILEVLRRVPPSERPDPAAVNVFQEVRANDPAVAVLSGHTAPVADVAYSPDGSRIVTGSEDHTARIWDARTGMQLLVLTGHTKDIRSAVYSPDGTEILTGAIDGTARTWDARTGKPRRVLQHASLVACASYSPDGKKILTAGDNRWREWDATTGAPLAEVSGNRHGCGRYSPDGTRIVMRSEDPNTVRIWDAHTGASLAELSGHAGPIQDARFSPDGRQIVTSSSDVTVRTWDARTGAPLLVLNGDSGEVPSAVWSPDGATIATTSTFKVVRLWDAKTGKQIKVLTGHTDLVGPAAFSPDGKHLVTGGSDSVARIWDVTGGPQGVVLSGHTKDIETVVYSPDGLQLATASEDTTARVWDARSGAQLTVLSGHTQEIRSVAYSPDGSRIVTSSVDGTVRVWEARTGAALLKLAAPKGGVMWASYSPDGGRIVGFFADLTFGIWDAYAGKQLVMSPGHHFGNFRGAYGVGATINYSPDGRRILTGCIDKTARVWDAKTLRQLAVLPHSDFVNSAFWSPDGRRIVTATDDRNANVWDAATGVRIAVLSGHHSMVGCAAFSPDGNRIVTSSGEDVRIWDAHSMLELAVLPVDGGGCAWSPDSTHVAGSSDDTTASIWDARVRADLPAQILWEQAAEPDPLADVQRTQLGFPPVVSLLSDTQTPTALAAGTTAQLSACDLQAAAFYDPDRRSPGVERESINHEVASSNCVREASTSGSTERATYQAGRALWADGQVKAARRYLERALERGYGAAQVDLALLLSDPSAGMLDPDRAVSLLRRAWEQGTDIAGFELGVLYERGVAASDGAGHAWPADPAKARYWCREAARRNEPNALAWLAARTEVEAVNLTSAANDAQLLAAFSLYARAAAHAEAMGWPVSVWKSWRYRRATLARVLAADGLMQEVANAYRSVLHETGR